MPDSRFLKILGRRSSSNVQKVLWLLSELDVPFDREDVGGKYGRNREDAYLALNPNGVVPTLIDGGFVLWESNSICRYLATKFGPTSFYPADLVNRALCERWMDWQLGTLSPVLGPFYIKMVRTPASDRDFNAVEEDRKQSRALLAILDRALRVNRFLEGDDLTLADIGTGIWAHRWFALNVETDLALANVRAWYERLCQRKPYRDCVVDIPFE
jgi:glutathione S-transferase